MIQIIDEPGVLSSEESSRLSNYIVDKCHCTSQELPRLLHIKLKKDGAATGSLAYWTACIEPGDHGSTFRAAIVLNTTYLKTVDQMERSLAHEYGHHWSLGFMLERSENPFERPAPLLYYQIRGLDPDQFVSDYSKDWDYCDKEVLAEDYKFRLTPHTGEHRMRDLAGNPTTEVRDFLWRLGRPSWF